MRAREGISGRWRRGRASVMDGADACRGARGHPRPQLLAARTLFSDDETTLPRMTGDVGLLMSTTTSELEKRPAT